METTAYDLARRFLGVHERAGAADHPLIRYCHSLTEGGEAPDEVAWCSSFAQLPAFLLDLPRSYSKAARSWLNIDAPAVPLGDARCGFDVVIFKRGSHPQPGPEVVRAPGHVAYFSRLDGDYVEVVGGNQGDAVTLSRFRAADVLGVRRLLP